MATRTAEPGRYAAGESIQTIAAFLGRSCGLNRPLLEDAGTTFRGCGDDDRARNKVGPTT
ncbi:helix-turn-helix domain-containing protein [Nonomuraea sp. KM90]|uniref:helix-turn-helix domain-containing protein n=1 Tax=Nonomuraea sp. KM90 TaxID=3457428 RepID=UPI003FCEC109